VAVRAQNGCTGLCKLFAFAMINPRWPQDAGQHLLDYTNEWHQATRDCCENGCLRGPNRVCGLTIPTTQATASCKLFRSSPVVAWPTKSF